MIKAIIFDCFGVLTSDGWLPFKKKHFAHDPELERQATDLNKQVDSGLTGYSEFLEKIADMAEVSREDVRRAIEGNVANDELFEYIQGSLKPQYKIGMLSNAGDNWLDELFTPDQLKLFDTTALSYETRVIKPDKKAYQIIAERLEVQPEECVFIDDLERYCTAARECGMRAIWYKNLEQFRQELEPLLARQS